MCLLTNQQVCLIAKKKIVCWKFLNKVDGKFYSPYQNFTWKRWKLFISALYHKSSEDWRNMNGHYTVQDGFHAYTKKEFANSKAEYQNVFYTADGKKAYFVKRFVIPKGARYFVSKCGKEIVTDRIRMR